MGVLQPVLDLGRVEGGEILEQHPLVPGRIGGGPRPARLGERLEGDVGHLAGEVRGARVGHREHLAAHLVDVVGAPEHLHGDARKGASRGVERVAGHGRTSAVA